MTGKKPGSTTRQRARDAGPWAAVPGPAHAQDGSGLGTGLDGALRAVDWDFADADTRRTGHGLHPYPAKFVPQIPEALIRLLTYPGELVLDCFGGSGTTAVEALRAGRRAISIDANPIADLITRVKTARLSAVAMEQLTTLISRVAGACSGADDLAAYGRDKWRPAIPNAGRWYAAVVMDELAGLRSLITEALTDRAARDLALLAFVTAATRTSYQDSETRYKSVPRSIPRGAPSQRFLAELQRMIRSIERQPFGQTNLTLMRGDARIRSAYPVGAETVDLVVTSPPYPNAYDYHLYHRFRIYWLGDEPHELRRTEIGSHLTNQAATDAVGKYERDMLAVLGNVANVLRPGRFAVFVVGDGVYRGEPYGTAAALSSLGGLAGLDTAARINRRLPAQRRSVTAAGRRLSEETLLVLRKADPAAGPALREPGYELYPYERQLARREAGVLRRETAATSLRHVRQAAFSYQVQSGKSYVPTLQRLSEHDPGRDQKKNSTYAAHGLHRYKGKFYPQLAKALINITDPYERTGLVCDPFGGSGTVAVEARLAGLDALTIDQNPVATAIARAKSDFLDLTGEQLRDAVTAVVNGLDGAGSSPDWGQFAAEVRPELESWFAPRILAKLSHLLRQIRRQAHSHPAYGPLAESVLSAVASDLVREISHQEPADLRIRRRFQALTDAPVGALFAERAHRLVERRRLIGHRLALGPPLGRAWAVHADAALPRAYRTEPGRPVHIAAVVSSPPYGMALPYLDTDRLSLAAIYGFDQYARKQLEEQLIGSREVRSRQQLDYWHAANPDFTGDLPPSTAEFLDSLGKAVAADPGAGFRKKQTPAVLTRYFVSMSRVFQQLAWHLTPGAELAIVLGDSATTVSGSHVVIPTADEISAIAKHRGLALIERIPITVTRENLLNSHRSIRNNEILRLGKE